MIEITKNNEFMAQYKISQGDLAVRIMQFREKNGPWKTMMSSVLRIELGLAGDKTSATEMLTNLSSLVHELRLVIAVLENAQRQMGNEYIPPLLPFKSEFMDCYPAIGDLMLATKDLYIALQERDICDNCGGEGWNYSSGGLDDRESCQCSEDAHDALAKHEGLFNTVIKW